MIEVNLLPDAQRERRSARRAAAGRSSRLTGVGKPRDPWGRALLVAAVVVPAAVLFLWWTQRSAAAELETRLEAATADSARLAELRAVSDSLTARREVVRQRIAVVEQLDRNRFVWPHVLDELSRALPALAWVTSLEQQTPLPDVSFRIQGLAANPLAITEFVRNLEASDYLTDVRILGSQRQELDGGELVAQAFTLDARYRMPPPAERTEPIVATTGN